MDGKDERSLRLMEGMIRLKRLIADLGSRRDRWTEAEVVMRGKEEQGFTHTASRSHQTGTSDDLAVGHSPVMKPGLASVQIIIK